MSSSVGQPFLSLTGMERADVASRRTQRTFILVVLSSDEQRRQGRKTLYNCYNNTGVEINVINLLCYIDFVFVFIMVFL